MGELTRRKKIISIFLVLIVIGVLSSGLFTERHGRFYFAPLMNQPPYYPGSYENYSILGSNLLYFGKNATGYLNVSSISNITTLRIHVKFYDSLEPVYVNRTVEVTHIGGKLYYNGSQIYLPFFYTGRVISAFNGVYENATSISQSMITQQVLYKFHPGIYVSTSQKSHLFGFYLFSAQNKMLIGMDGVNLIISHLLGVQVHDGSKSYPVALVLNLHSTNYIIFPVNWPYVILVYIVIVFSLGFIFIVPSAIILIVVAYRRKWRNRE